jgi:hypothetical protein
MKPVCMPSAFVLAAGVLAAFPVISQAATPTTLFSDDFSRCLSSNCGTIGNGWDEIEKSPGAVEIHALGTNDHYNWVLDLHGFRPGTTSVTNPDAAATHTFDASGYSDIRLSFQYRRTDYSTESIDLLYVSYNPGSNWIDLPAYALTPSAFESVTDLSLASAANTNGVSLRFWLDNNSGGTGPRGAYVDDVQVTGMNVVTGMVPEPETYAMLLAGLGLVGFIARRRK